MIECFKNETEVEEERYIPFDLLSSYTVCGINSVRAVAEFISLATLSYKSFCRHSYNSSLFA